jgi:hypothetical protein
LNGANETHLRKEFPFKEKKMNLRKAVEKGYRKLNCPLPEDPRERKIVEEQLHQWEQLVARYHDALRSSSLDKVG